MASKQQQLFFKQQQQLTVTGQYRNKSCNQFSELDFNRGHECLNDVPFVHSFSKTNSHKHFAYNGHEKGNSWNKSATKDSSFKTLKKQSFNVKPKERAQKRWMNEKNDSRSSNGSSTLSLHIAAYENFVEDSLNKNYPMKSKAFNTVVTVSKFQEDPFEFPRQMDGNNRSTPEIQQFTAAQRLFSPNRGAAGSSSHNQRPPEVMATSRGGEGGSGGGYDNTSSSAAATEAAAAAARFNLPPDDSDDEDDDDSRVLEEAENEEIRQKINLQLTDIFQKDLHIFQTCDDNIQEEWVQKRPKIVFNYLFGNEIGNGSYGKVKEVLHYKTNVRRAVKIIKDKKVCKIPLGIINVQREFSILKQLDHPNIIRLIESFRVESKAKLYLIFEYCVTSMDCLLESSPLKRMNEYQTYYYFSQLISGLEYLHSNGVIHKDIKPTNLLVNEENTLKIADFGVAEKHENPNDDICTMSQGTPAFQAPEVVMGDNPTFRGKCIDIWACGVTLYRIVTGGYPYQGNVLMKLFDNIVNEPFELPSDVKLSEEVVELISGMLIKNPTDRWTLIQIKEAKWMTMIHALDNENLIPLPAIDNTSFEEKLQEIQENFNDIDVVDDAIPFNGSFPSSVIDRTLQTPAFNRTTEEYRTVNLSEENDPDHLQPIRLEFETGSDGEMAIHETPTNSPLIITTNNAPPSSTTPPTTNNATTKVSPPRRHHRHRIFNCFRPSNNSPD